MHKERSGADKITQTSKTHPESKTCSHKQIFSTQKHISYNHEWHESPQGEHYKVSAHKLPDSCAIFAKYSHQHTTQLCCACCVNALPQFAGNNVESAARTYNTRVGKWRTPAANWGARKAAGRNTVALGQANSAHQRGSAPGASVPQTPHGGPTLSHPNTLCHTA